MSATIINFIIQLIVGAVGGYAVGAASKDINLGTLGNTIVGAIGGVGGGQLLSALVPALAGVGNHVDTSQRLPARWWEVASLVRLSRPSSA
jgi:uncharacterized membrane protein YeaQ/YmgE (transglycosylase-associated protein family)